VYGRTFTFETYELTLPDGTLVTHSVGKLKGEKTTLTETDWEEWQSLVRAGEGEDLGIEEKEVKGQVLSFRRQRFTLSNGTEFIWSVGEPKSH